MRSRLPERLAPRVPPLATEILVGLGIALAAVVVRQSLLPLTGDRAPFAIMFVAVLLASLLAGWRSAILALVVGQVLTWYVIMEPAWSFGLYPGDLQALIMASASELVLVVMIALYQREIEKDARAMEEQLQIRDALVGELNHRVKNTLAIVQSIGHQSLRSDVSSEQAAQSFEGRLIALASAHQILTHENWQPVNIIDLISTTLAPHGGVGSQFLLDGPDVSLSPKTSVTLAMTVHELATNALKYGALSEPDGRVDIRWSLDADCFRLNWTERGGPPASNPVRKGFGTRMLERALASEIGGKAVLTFSPDGLVYSVEAPPRQPL